MGYCIDVLDMEFSIPAKNREKALNAINVIMDPKIIRENGQGGAWTGGKQTGWWYSWVENPEGGKFKTLEDAMDAWGFPIKEKNGQIVCDYHTFEKLGQQEVLLQAIAPYVKKGSYIEISGEDGARWMWKFNGKTFITKVAKIRY